MDYAYRSYGDRDLICGYRMMMTRSPELQLSMCHLQQRKYLKALKYAESCKDGKRSRGEMLSGNHDEIANFEGHLNKVYTNDIIKECYKNLNQWDELEKDKSDISSKI